MSRQRDSRLDTSRPPVAVRAGDATADEAAVCGHQVFAVRLDRSPCRAVWRKSYSLVFIANSSWGVHDESGTRWRQDAPALLRRVTLSCLAAGCARLSLCAPGAQNGRTDGRTKRGGAAAAVVAASPPFAPLHAPREESLFCARRPSAPRSTYLTYFVATTARTALTYFVAAAARTAVAACAASCEMMSSPSDFAFALSVLVTTGSPPRCSLYSSVNSSLAFNEPATPLP
ncbi:MAG: hypothetical protein QOD32_1958 [Pyrinomonadaceae bacterium]|nr:hypothetical protein [Pyrinomonadaceae bacterium]